MVFGVDELLLESALPGNVCFHTHFGDVDGWGPRTDLDELICGVKLPVGGLCSERVAVNGCEDVLWR